MRRLLCCCGDRRKGAVAGSTLDMRSPRRARQRPQCRRPTGSRRSPHPPTCSALAASAAFRVKHMDGRHTPVSTKDARRRLAATRVAAPQARTHAGGGGTRRRPADGSTLLQAQHPRPSHKRFRFLPLLRTFWGLSCCTPTSAHMRGRLLQGAHITAAQAVTSR
ncbi:hypothetical protein EON66_09070 [archaeon]|nr:MAG: hypothetical protein EON66_09070 [archaeon]